MISKQLISGFIKSASTSIVKHSPEIMVGFAIAGVVVTTITAYKASPKAHEIVNRKKQELEDIPVPNKAKRRQIKMEMAKELAPVLAPVAVSGLLTIAMMVGSHSISVRRQMVLSTAYELTNTAFKEYKEKTKTIVGEKKEALIREELAKDYMKDKPLESMNTIVTGDGNYTFYDRKSGRKFKSDIEKIRFKVNQLNYRLMTEMFISQNDFYYELGLDPVYKGDDYGWNVESGLIDLDIQWIPDEYGNPYGYITYDLEPRADLYGF